MSDADHAHRLIFERLSATRFAKQFSTIKAASKLPLDGAVRQQLSDGLYKAQKNQLILAIDADLNLFRRTDTDHRPTDNILNHPLGKAKLTELHKTLGDVDGLLAFKPDGAPDPDPKRAYTFYCEDVLGEGFRIPHLWSESGRFAQFKRRNPMAVLLLGKVFDNFVANVSECLQRVSSDLAALQACFLGGQAPQRIVRIVCTGSDSQRGGKQVLFLDIQAADKSLTRIVYKPSDVEIDYLLVGRNAGAVNDFLTGVQGQPGYAAPRQSLFELVNATLQAQGLTEAPGTRALSTYGVLPRYPGSTFAPGQTAPPIRDSYGYLEFLHHGPKPTREPLGGMDSLLDSFTTSPEIASADERDWIVDDEDQVAACMRNWGRLGMLTAVMMMRDLHFENRRLRRANPTLIDLEMTGTGVLDKAGETALFQGMENAAQPTGGELEVGFVEGFAGPVGIPPTSTQWSWSLDQLYLTPVPGRPAMRCQFNSPPAVADIQQGLADILRHLGPGALKSWITQVGLGQVIVRYLSLEKFGGMLEQELRILFNEHKPQPDAAQALATYWQARMSKRRREQVTLWLNGSQSPDQRAYAFETPDYTGMDLLNLDSPRFFRRMNSRSVMASDGKPVRFEAQYFDLDSLFPGDTWQQTIETGMSKSEAMAALNFDRFRTTTGLDDLSVTIDRRLGLKPADQGVLLQKDIDSIVPPVRSITLGRKKR